MVGSRENRWSSRAMLAYTGARASRSWRRLGSSSVSRIDGAFEVPTGALLTLKTSTSGQLSYGPRLQTLTIYPTTATGPAAIPDIRRAEPRHPRTARQGGLPRHRLPPVLA